MSAKKADTRQQVLEVAVELFSRKGYEATSVQEIAGKAGVSKPVLYYYFKNKEDLFLSILVEGFDRRLRVMQQAVANGDSWPVQFANLMRASLHFVGSQKAISTLTVQALVAPIDSEPDKKRIFSLGARNFEFVRSFFQVGIDQGFLRKDVSCETLAMMFYAHYMLTMMIQNTPAENVRSQMPDGLTLARLFLCGAAEKDALK
jgi:AcrR family transcriptional regulator